MNPFNTRLLKVFVLGSVLFAVGCVDSLTSTDISEEFATETRSSESVRTAPLLRNPQLLEAALSKTTSSFGKGKPIRNTVTATDPVTDEPVTTDPVTDGPIITYPDLFAFIG